VTLTVNVSSGAASTGNAASASSAIVAINLMPTSCWGPFYTLDNPAR
jgi:hypothetical protein